jgi:hypothetical protein
MGLLAASLAMHNTGLRGFKHYYAHYLRGNLNAPGAARAPMK